MAAAGLAGAAGDGLIAGLAPGLAVGLAAGLGAVMGAGAFLSPRILGSPVSNTPATAPIMIVARVPTNRAFQPSSEISLRREGIKALVPPTKIPTEAR